MKKDSHGEFFNEFSWHSSIGIDSEMEGNKVFYTRLANTDKSRTMFFLASDSNFLIHKTTKSLWKISEDGGSIVPVFDSDVLTEEDLKNI